jgi:hypothetical protein
MRRQLSAVVRLVCISVMILAAGMSGVAADSEPAFWSSEETAAYLGVPISTLRYWSWQRTGPRSYRIGRYRKYRPTDVRRWAERQADEPQR